MRTHEGEGERSEIEFREVHSFVPSRVGIVAVSIKNVTGVIHSVAVPYRFTGFLR